jgi:hypothetical protein
MFDINAFSLLTKALTIRDFDISTSFDSWGHGFEAIRLFSNGDYYLFTLEFKVDSPLRLEVKQDGHESMNEFESLISVVDVKRIILLCEELRFPYGWNESSGH